MNPLLPYPLREDPTPRPLPPFGLCGCFEHTCRGGQVINGRLANGDICRAAIPACQRPVEPPAPASQRDGAVAAVQPAPTSGGC